MNSPADLQPSPRELFELAECGLFARPWREGKMSLCFSGQDARFGISYAPCLPLPWSVYFPVGEAGEPKLAYAPDLDTVLMLYAMLMLQ